MNELKGINDTLGHAEGDKALVQIGTVLKKTSFHGTLIYRMGGDEFTVICTDSDKNDIEKIVKNIEHEMNKTPYTCSIGYACQDGGKTLDELNREADKRMYDNKQKYYDSHDRIRLIMVRLIQ
ncbi:GGDEF domain-containing protein [Butyrivibrio fibrisolvens]|uniref:GGDEF domain-containing protein n=1 Tax=Butyrivibrio fibrisolvens TaxID=831 RepID=UPI0004853E8D|nr:GGDEF domain-containing protein [Butyrivibrio fibrisolvens]